MTQPARASISVLCPTAHPGPLVAANLRDLRPHVDEILVAADARAGAEDLGWYASVADRVLRFEFSGSNRHWAWLAAQAAGDWVLLLDGDEITSEALNAALPELTRDRRVNQYRLPLRWLWPDAGTRLAGPPWGADRQLRLLRNDGRLFFYGRKHLRVHPDFPVRYADDLPIYHLDLVLGDVASRRDKARRYDAERFGLLTAEGLPFNAAWYLPEDREDVALEPIPAGDRDRIAAALEAGGTSPPAVDPASLALHDRAAVEARWADRPLGPDAYRAEVALADPLPPITAVAPAHEVWVRVRNTGTARWPGGEDRPPLIRLGLRWQDASGTVRGEARAMLPGAVDPGEDALVPVLVPGPPAAGQWRLRVDMVHERVRWFETPLDLDVDAMPSVRDQLAALRAEHGDVLPLAAVWELRRAAGRADALMGDVAGVEGPPQPPSDPAIAALVAGLPIGGWALDGPTIDRLVETVRAQRPDAVAEFGAGTSTLALAHTLAEVHGTGRRRLVSFEQDADWVGLTRERLAERGLDGMAEVVHLPIGPADGSGPACYAMTDRGRALLDASPPELVIVDGPSQESGASRLGVIDLVAPHVARPATVLLDDALRDAELSVADAWARRDDVTIDGIRLIGKGLLEAHLAPAPRAAARAARRRPLRWLADTVSRGR